MYGNIQVRLIYKWKENNKWKDETKHSAAQARGAVQDVPQMSCHGATVQEQNSMAAQAAEKSKPHRIQSESTSVVMQVSGSPEDPWLT